MNQVSVALGLAALAAVCACAAPAAPAEAAETRVLVKLVRPSNDTAAIARMASEAALLPVRYLSATSSQWHVLALRCGAAAACDAALQRLRADPAAFAVVERDERKRIVSP